METKNKSTKMNPKIYNSLTRTKEEVTILPNEKFFKMYCCGPTVYGPAHIGNFRTFIVQDTLRRVLEISGFNVIHARNITDVDDKTIRESRKLNISLKDFTRKWEDKFHIDCDKLNMLPPTIEPRATEHIQEQINMISKLVEKGFAYPTSDGSVYFKISSFKDYGKLSGLDTSQLNTQTVNSAGENNSADEYERENVSDFALWKGRKPDDGENFWKSPWGDGRPGWHIECSAMAHKFFGASFDLHGGGVDLCFPHHENEIAQSECATGVSPCVRYWFHSAHLMVEGEKMSKSLGNLYTLDDLSSKNFTPNQIRWTLLSGHYKQQLNFTIKGLEDAKSAISKLEKNLLPHLSALNIDKSEFRKIEKFKANFDETIFDKAWNVLCDDLNVPRSFGEIFSAFSKKNFSKNDLDALKSLLYALGINLFVDESEEESVPAEIVKIAQNRWEAKKNKNFSLADSLRAEAVSKGWNILDKKDGFNLKKI